MAKPKPIAQRTFTRRPTDAELAHIVAELGIDVPVYKTRAVGGRLELYLYSGIIVSLAPGQDPTYHDQALGPHEASRARPSGPKPVRARSPRPTSTQEE